MGILLFVLGLLAVGSGGIKLRHGAPARAWALAELLLGAATVLASGLGIARARPVAWAVVAALAALVIGSSWVHLRGAVEAARERAASEAARLREHLSGPDERP